MIDKIVNFAIKRKKYNKTNYLFYFNKSDKKISRNCNILFCIQYDLNVVFEHDFMA